MTLLLAIAGGIALPFIINGPIAGSKHFAHDGLVSAFSRHDLCQSGTHNLSIDHATTIRPLLGQAIRDGVCSR
jgi:hypothetical protein